MVMGPAAAIGSGDSRFDHVAADDRAACWRA
jgi:hypothetical protein